MKLTEDLLKGLASHVDRIISSQKMAITRPKIDFASPFRCLDFLPALELAMEHKLPDLGDAQANEKVIRLFQQLSIPLPETTSLPQMLDKLCATYLEPKCLEPTFIINHPVCLSPLSKSFDHPKTGERVAARAELFVQSKEIVNMYEEENSPIEQRKKFIEQLHFKDDREESNVDESYLETLEWALPPTGGWGGGIERLCMLMTGVNRIGDVLSFGTLRNVMAMKGRS